MNTLIIMLDGAADEKIPAFDYKTPLESLAKPFMDSVASNGLFGWTEGQKYTHLFLLGFFTGKVCDVPRGLIEANGMDVPLQETSMAYRFSPACFKNGKFEWAYRVSPDKYPALQNCMIDSLDLLSDLTPNLYFHGCDGRGVITVEDELYDFPMPPYPLPECPDYGPFRECIEAVADQLNGLTFLPWGGGSVKSSAHKSAFQKSKELTILSGSPSALGVGRLLGINSKRVDDFRVGMEQSLSMIQQSDVFLHVDETDDVSHRTDPQAKQTMLAEIDDFFSENIDFLDGHRVALIIDHGTSSLNGQHMPMPVPFAVSKISAAMKSQLNFCENTDKHYPLESLFCSIMQHTE